MQGNSTTRLWLSAAVIVCAAVCGAQTPKPSVVSRYRQEFPIALHQKVVAGQSAVGTIVEGKLIIPTLVQGVVIPDGAVFKGKVEESVAKTEKSPSRLKVHLTEARWENQFVAVDLYLTSFYYQRLRTSRDEEAEDMAPPIPALSGRPVQHPENDVPKKPRPRWPQRKAMDDVKQERGTGSEVILTSEKQNIRLDRDTIYSFEGSATAKPAVSRVN